MVADRRAVAHGRWTGTARQEKTVRRIHIEGTWFKDGQGRTLILRGVNLGGSSKVPCQPDGASHRRAGFFDHRNVSFVGRPFPLQEADEHLGRLRAWGFTFLRFLVPWEAVEHAGPGIYDEPYLAYVYDIVRKAEAYGIQLFIDPHQDVWSRMSGGDGAPGWTLDAVGMDVTRFAETGAAIVHATHGDPFPRMIWPTNASKLAAATMFSLFFGGNTFAPKTRVAGEPVQEFLQRHYIAAIQQVATRLKDLPNVVGYDTLNEPSPGYIGWPDLRLFVDPLRYGPAPTPFQAMALGGGYPQAVEVWGFRRLGFRRQGHRLINPQGVRVWKEGMPGVWRENGVWDIGPGGGPRLLRPHHFAQVDGGAVDFANDYLKPFLLRYAAGIRAVDRTALLFVEGQRFSPPPTWGAADPPGIVHAAHWYDGLTLFAKRFIPTLGVDLRRQRLVVGARRVERSFVRQLAGIMAETGERMGPVPTLIGEFGIPFDMHNQRAYRTGDFSRQVRALDRTFRALEANLLSGTLWNYTADNDNRRGDQWNGEDLSIFSRDQQTDPDDLNSGGRALEAAVRPYACKVAGEPLDMTFDLKRRVFRFSFRHDPYVSAPTEIFVPSLHYPAGYTARLSDGEYEADPDAQRLLYRHSLDREVHQIQVQPV
jgi:hypothetical protein